MEYVHGLPLAGVLTAGVPPAPVPVEIAVAIAEAVLLGLHAAHEARAEDGTPLGIVHRDVSPQNVLIGADGVPRLIDFGIAKAATRIQETDPGVVKGKAGYMAPEQLLYEPVSRQADVFSASVVLWEMLVGRRLFPLDVNERVGRMKEPASAPSGERRGIDGALDDVVLRGLDRDPKRRFPTAEAMAVELRRGRAIASAVDIARWLEDTVGDELELSAERVQLFEQLANPVPEPPSSALVTSVAATTTTQGGWKPEAKPKRARGWLVAIGVGLATSAALIAFQLVSHRGEAAAPARASGELVAAELLPAPRASSVESAHAVSPLPPTPSTAVVSSAAAPAPRAPVVTTSKPPPSHAPAAAKAKCDPPYTVDAKGFKHYDRNCF